MQALLSCCRCGVSHSCGPLLKLCCSGKEGRTSRSPSILWSRKKLCRHWWRISQTLGQLRIRSRELTMPCCHWAATLRIPYLQAVSVRMRSITTAQVWIAASLNSGAGASRWAAWEACPSSAKWASERIVVTCRRQDTDLFFSPLMLEFRQRASLESIPDVGKTTTI